MNFRRGARRDEPEINFIPLIDLLLVVLIFLLVSTSYTRFAELGIELPSASAERSTDRPGEIMVAVLRDGRYAIDGATPVTRTPQVLSLDLQAAARDRQRPVVVIHADAGATHQAVINVMEAARLAGLARVSFTTQDAP